MKRLAVLLVAVTMIFTLVASMGIATAGSEATGRAEKRVVVIDGERYIIPDCCDAETLNCAHMKSDFLKSTMTPEDYIGGG